MTAETLTTHRSLIAGIGDALVKAFVKLCQRSPAARCAEEAERLFALVRRRAGEARADARPRDPSRLPAGTSPEAGSAS